MTDAGAGSLFSGHAPLPMGPFRMIAADPPWRFATFSEKGRDRSPDGPLTRNQSRQNSPARHYDTMPLDQIKALPVADVAADDCLLLLWAVDPMIPEAIDVGRAWGFTYKTVGFYWIKERRETSTRGRDMEAEDHKRYPMGTGYWTRANPESCLLFTRGAPSRASASVRKLIVAPRREHSRKPESFYSSAEQLMVGPKLEMFARAERPNWSVWGNQTDKFSEVRR